MSTLVRLLWFLRGHRPRVALAVLLGSATIAANVGLLAISAYLVSDAALRPSLLALWVPIYLVQFFGVSRAFFRYGERLVSHRLTLGLLADVRTWFYGRLVPLAPARLPAYRSGDLLARLAADVQELEQVFLRGVAPPVVALLVTAGVAGILAAFSPSLAVAAVLCLLLAGVGVPLLARALARRAGRAYPALRAALTTQLIDGIQGMPDALAFGLAAEQRERLATRERALGATRRRMALVDGLRGALDLLTANLALVTILALATPPVVSGRIGGVYLAFLALLVFGSFEVVQPLGQAFQHLGRSLAAGERLFEVADAAPEVTDPPTPLLRPAGIPTLTFDRVSFAYDHAPEAKASWQGHDHEWSGTDVQGGRLAQRTPGSAGTMARTRDARWLSRSQPSPVPRGDATYAHEMADPAGFSRRGSAMTIYGQVGSSYESGWCLPSDRSRRPTLQDVSFELAPGRRIALVGPSGSGKSTLARLALRAWDPSYGAIRLDGAPLSRYGLDDVRSLFAVVAQDTYIFADTLRNNLLLARPAASEGELAGVIAQARLAELVARLPRGLDGALGEQGQQISGGERQRVAIARALLQGAPILLLDEATANLDPLTERALLETIHDLLRGRSLLLISHRLVTMERMDEILVLDQGRIVERGTHTALLAARGHYHQLFEAQNALLVMA